LSTPDSQKYDLTRKDPLVSRPDAWDFPTSQSLDARWLGRVHRGTPWQTLYLKPAGADPALWKTWVGVTDDQEAQSLQPTNDWRLASLVASLINTNDPRILHPVNQPNLPGWLGILDGLIVLTNSTTDDVLIDNYVNSHGFWLPPFDTLTMTSNSPQATIIATAIAATRANQPGHLFRCLGDIFATPELSIVSPWLNEASDYQLRYGISDAAYEMIPSQLLALLRPDSIASILQTGPTLEIQFTGADGYAYAVQTSSNLLNWTTISTNYPCNGVFTLSQIAPQTFLPRFYRSVLLP
jgi:hypothetical protein